MKKQAKDIVLIAVMGITLFGLSLWCFVKTPEQYSDSERRALAQAPTLTLDSFLSGEYMQDFEQYSLDQFPARDSFRAIKTATEMGIFQKKDNNGIYLADGHIADLDYTVNEQMLDHAADRFDYIYQSYFKDTNAKLYFSIVPDKNYVLAADNGYLSMDYDYLTDYMKDKTDYMQYIDIFDLMSAEDYYYTDSHWRQERIGDVADRLANSMGKNRSQSYTQMTLDSPFYGVYYGQAALSHEPDSINYLTNDRLESCIVTGYDTGTPKQLSIYDMQKAQGKDAYEMFLSGTQAIMTIENPNCETDSELIVFRDSYASSLTPLLCECYSKITLIDIRYVQSSMLGQFIDVDDQDVLFLYSTMLLNNSLALK